MSNLILVVGKKGAGKSFLSLSLSCQLDPEFRKRDKRWVFSIDDFNDWLKAKPKRGSCIVFDEVGVAANCRDAPKKANKHLSYIAQTIRPMGITVFCTVPSWKLFDAQVRNLVDYRIQVDGYDKQTGLTEFKIFQISPNQNSEEPLATHLIFDEKMDGFWRPVKRTSWYADCPPADIANEYQNARDAFSWALVEKGADVDEPKYNQKKSINYEELADKVLSNKEMYLTAKGALNAWKAMTDFGLSEMCARRLGQCVRGRVK